jgi:hypothetical protein
MALLVIDILDGRVPSRGIGGNVVLQRHRNIDQPSRHLRVPQSLLPRRRYYLPALKP